MSKKLLGIHEVPTGSKLKLKSADHGSKPAAYKFVVVDSDSGDDQGQLVSLASSQKIIRAGDIVDGAVGPDALAATTVAAGSYGSSTAVPTFTVDADGRLTAAGTESIVTTLTVDGDSSTADCSLASDDLKILGGTGLSAAVAKSGTDVSLTMTLDDTAVSAASYGSAAVSDFKIPRFTVDAQGRITAASEKVIQDADADGSTKGVASFASADFSASSGVISIKDLGVSNAQLAGSIANSKLSNSTISGVALGGTLAELSDGNGIADFSYTGTSAASVAVQADGSTLSVGASGVKVADGGVGTTQLAADAVTAAKLADDAVVTDNIVDANVTNVKLANSSMTIAGSSVSLGGAITAATIAAAVDGEDMAITGLTDLDVKQAGNITILDTVGANTLTVGASGTTVSIAGNLSVAGTQTTFDSTTVSVADPIIEMGDDSSDDNLDRGIKMKYNDGAAKVAFMGFDEDEQKFMMIPDATDNSSVISGTQGVLKADLDGKLATARTIAVAGDAVGSASFDGSDNISISVALSNDSVDSAEIAASAVTASELASNAVITAKILDANVTTAKLAADAVTAAKLADDAVVTDNIVDANVTTAKLADDSVTAAKLASDSVVNASVVNGALKADKLDIDGSTDIGAALADADLFIVDDGAGGTNRKSELSRIKTYLASASNNGLKVDGSSFFVAPSDFTSATPDLTADDMALNDVPVTTSLSSPLNASAGAAFNYVILAGTSLSVDEDGYIDYTNSNSMTYGSPKQIVAVLDDGSRTVVVYQGSAISVSGSPLDFAQGYQHNHTSKYIHFWNDGRSSGNSSDGSFQLGSASNSNPPGSGGTNWSSAFFRIPASNALSITAASHGIQHKESSSQKGEVMALDKSGLSSTIMNGRNAATGWSLNSDTNIFGASDSLLWLEDSGATMFDDGNSNTFGDGENLATSGHEFFVGTRSVTPGTGVPRKASLASMFLAAAGDGLEQDSSSKALKVKVDDSSIAISSDTVGIKPLGVTTGHLAGATYNGSAAPSGFQLAWAGSAWGYARPSLMAEFECSWDTSGDCSLASSQPEWVTQSGSGPIKIELDHVSLFGPGAASQPLFMAQVFVETSTGIQELAGTNMKVDSSNSGVCIAEFDLDGAALNTSSDLKVFIGFVQMGGLVNS